MPEITELERHALRLKWHKDRSDEQNKRARAEAERMGKVYIHTASTLLPEGGSFVMQWPETISPHSLDMVEGFFKLQWGWIREYVADREKEIDAALPPPPAADKCRHARSKWNVLGTHGTCQDCGAALTDMAECERTAVRQPDK